MDKKTYRSEKLAQRKNSTNFRPNIQNCSSALIQSDDVLTEKELNEALRKSGKDTAAGSDRIRYSDIKNLTEEDRAELYTIYQESFHKGYIPEDWTGSFLKSIPISGKDHHKLNGCRTDAEHRWEVHGRNRCQEIRQRPRGHRDTLCKSGKYTQKNAFAFAYDVYERFQRKEQALAVVINLEVPYNSVQIKLLMSLYVQYKSA